MTFTRRTGDHGTSGQDGTTTHIDGGNGGAGADAVYSLTNERDRKDIVYVTGGAGGFGGDGYRATRSSRPGYAGAGGAGGDATAGAWEYFASKGKTVAGAYAQGGAGGAAGLRGYSYQSGAGYAASSGRGGDATASARSTARHATRAQAQAWGGAGGNAQDDSASGGAGGTASGTATATVSGSGAAVARLAVTGGRGGYGYYGGAGGSVALAGSADAPLVSAYTNHDRAKLYQSAEGGDGGGSTSNVAGRGGDAASDFVFADDELQNASIAADSFARGGNGGDGFSAGANGGAARATGDLTGLAASMTAWAIGGDGGNSTHGGPGGRGGAATSMVALTTANPVEGAMAQSRATGGLGGAGTSNTNGGAGGAANANAQAHNDATGVDRSDEQAADTSVGVYAMGGDGGSADGAGRFGGTGGSATGKASGTSAAASVLHVQVIAVAGRGGSGSGGAAGGGGGSANLENAVSGETANGYLELTQIAVGGDGGGGYLTDGGEGGDATSNLTLTDTTSKSIRADLRAYGGDGGSSASLPEKGGNGTVKLDVTGRNAVSGYIIAAGGEGSTSEDVHATGKVTGRRADLNATAEKHSCEDGSEAASRATGIGRSGNVLTEAEVEGLSPSNGDAYRSFHVSAAHYLSDPAQAATTTRCMSKVTIATGAQRFDTKSQAVALLVGDPTKAAFEATLDSDPKLAEAFAYSTASDVVALGEFGGSHTTQGTQTETIGIRANMLVDSSQLSAHGHLVLGLYDGTKVGAGISGMSLAIQARYTQSDGTVVQQQLLPAETFKTTKAALAYFKDNPIDLGSLDSINGGDPFYLDIALSETTTQPGGFYGHFVVGDSASQPARAAPLADGAATSHALFASVLADAFHGPAAASGTAASLAGPATSSAPAFTAVLDTIWHAHG